MPVVAHAHGDLLELGMVGKGTGLEAIKNGTDGSEVGTHTSLVVGVRRHTHHAANTNKLKIGN